MSSRVEEFDLQSPQPIWGMDGYSQLVLLVRSRARPIGILTVPTNGADALSPDDIQRLVAERLPLGAYELRNLPMDSSEKEALPAISVVICTKDRPNPLDRCLTSLAGVRYDRYEVVVVDNGSAGDATAKVATSHGVRYVREDRPGLDRARNRGIAEATHDLIAFTDDDVRVDSEWLAALGTAFGHSGIDAVTGLILPQELETEAQNYFEIYGDGMNKGVKPRVFNPQDLTSRERIAVQHVGVGANMAARKAVLLELDGFDPALDVGSPAAGAGDLDMFHRLLTAGKTVRYEPRALVWHQHRRDMASLTNQIRNNGRSFGVYLLKLLRHGTVPRRTLLTYATWTWGRWLMGRVVLGLLGRHRLPTRLLWAELRGALGAPLAYFATYRWSKLTGDR